MTSIPKWGGRRAQEWTALVLAAKGRVCLLQIEGVCTWVATEADHIVPRSVDLSLQYVVSNGRPACMPCNRWRGNRLVEPIIVDPLGLLSAPHMRSVVRPDLPPGTPEKPGSGRTVTEEGRP